MSVPSVPTVNEARAAVGLPPLANGNVELPDYRVHTPRDIAALDAAELIAAARADIARNIRLMGEAGALGLSVEQADALAQAVEGVVTDAVGRLGGGP